MSEPFDYEKYFKDKYKVMYDVKQIEVVVGECSDQVGGTHYSNKAIQPIDYISANGLNFSEGSVVKYITRHKEKGGAEDIRKIKQYCDFILKYEYGE